MKGKLSHHDRCMSHSVNEGLSTEKYTKKKPQSSGFKDKGSPQINNFEEEAE